MRLIYCYDAYCGWCYAFSPVVKKINETFGQQFPISVLSGGMLIPNYAMPISIVAPTILDLITQIESNTPTKFGDDYLWHLKNPNESDWFPNSLPPAIALCIIKDIKPEKALDFATKIQYGLNYEGRDLTDNEAYRHILNEYEINPEIFFDKIKEEKYLNMANNEFDLCKQLKVNAFPALFLQISESKFFLLSNGYMEYEKLAERIRHIQNEIAAQLN